jgi:hypothetical protein
LIVPPSRRKAAPSKFLSAMKRIGLAVITTSPSTACGPGGGSTTSREG